MIADTKIMLRGLPKISLNEWYAGKHWAYRKKIKDAYKLLVKSQTKVYFKKTLQYDVTYKFGFKSRPLDAMNTTAIAKLVEDILFEDDKWSIVRSVTLSSEKAKEDIVEITVKELRNLY
jgi:hypothetical protein